MGLKSLFVAYYDSLSWRNSKQFFTVSIREKLLTNLEMRLVKI